MRIFNATCTAGIIRVNNLIVASCPNLGEGGTSTGYLLIAENTLFYLPKTTPDVKSFLTQIENLCTKLEGLCDKIAAITVTCASPGSPSSAPINAADFATIKTDITSIHTNLTNLKGALK